MSVEDKIVELEKQFKEENKKLEKHFNEKIDKQALEQKGLKKTVEDEIYIRETITVHIDHFVEDLIDKVTALEHVLIHTATTDVVLLKKMAKTFKGAAYDIIKNKGKKKK